MAGKWGLEGGRWWLEVVLFSGDGAGVADPMMRERRERWVEKKRGRGCVCAGGKRKKMKEWGRVTGEERKEEKWVVGVMWGRWVWLNLACDAIVRGITLFAAIFVLVFLVFGSWSSWSFSLGFAILWEKKPTIVYLTSRSGKAQAISENCHGHLRSFWHCVER